MVRTSFCFSFFSAGTWHCVLAALLAAIAPLSTAGEVEKTELGPVRVHIVARGLEHPWGLAFLPDGRMLVTERPGRLRIVDPDGSVSPPLSGLPEITARGQGGLLDVALHPEFVDNGLVYLSYVAKGPTGVGTQVARGRYPRKIFMHANARVIELFVLATEPARTRGRFDFGASDVALRIRDAGMALSFDQCYWHTPPADAVFLHRKLGGLYLLAARLPARVDVRAILQLHLTTEVKRATA